MKIPSNSFIVILSAVLVSALFCSCRKNDNIIQSGKLKIEVNDQLQTRVSSDSAAKPFMQGFQSSEFVIADGDTVTNFKMKSASSDEIKDFASPGNSCKYIGVAENKDVKIKKILTISVYTDFPGWAFYKVQYINKSKKDILINKWVNHSYKIESNKDVPDFWSFQASSTGERKSWILPVDTGFYQKNFLGMNDPDYGGGIPVMDLWRKDAGIAIGHTALKPKLISLPVHMGKDETSADIAVDYTFETADTLHPGDTLNTLETFVTVHNGDNFNTLKQYSAFMQKKGIVMPASEPLAFEPMWCAWGYMRKFTLAEIIGTLPKVKELGFTWVTLDDGYQQAEGDWHTNRERFPNGDADMKKLVNLIHSYGF